MTTDPESGTESTIRRVLVLGANGPTGREVVAQALQRELEVTAITRHPDAFPITDDRIRLVGGDATDPSTIESAVAGCDAAISVIGTAYTWRPIDVYSASAALLMSAMQRHGIRRLVTVTSMGVPREVHEDGVLRTLLLRLWRSTFTRTLYDDMLHMERIVSSSRRAGMAGRTLDGEVRVVSAPRLDPRRDRWRARARRRGRPRRRGRRDPASDRSARAPAPPRPAGLPDLASRKESHDDHRPDRRTRAPADVPAAGLGGRPAPPSGPLLHVDRPWPSMIGLSMWSSGRPGLGVWSTTDSLAMLSMLAERDFDYLAIDLQHGHLGLETLPRAIGALTAYRGAVLVRVPWNRPEYIMRALDSGADGVIVPMVDDARSAAEAVAAARFPAAGSRSWGPLRSSSALAPAEADAAAAVFVMIETVEGLRNAPAIAQVAGLTGVYVGPNDLALSLGFGRRTMDDEPGLADAVASVRRACDDHGLISGFHANSPAVTTTRAAEGFTMITVATDLGLFEAALGDTARAVDRGSGDPGGS